RRELEIGIGSPQRAEQLLARLRVENVMHRMKDALGNSKTAQYLYDAMGFTAAAGLGEDLGSAHDMVGLGLQAVLGAGLLGGERIDQRVMERVAQMLASGDQTYIDRAIHTVANNTGFRRLLTFLDNVTSRAGTSQTAGGASRVPAVQSLVPGRAEEEQPQVP